MSVVPVVPPPPSIGHRLLAAGIISPDQLRIALTEQRRHDAPLGRTLVQLGFVSEEAIRDTLSGPLGAVATDLDKATVDPVAVAMVPEDLARRCHVLPIAFDVTGQVLKVALSDPANVVALDQVRSRLPVGVRLEASLARETDIALGVERLYGREVLIDGILDAIEAGPAGVANAATGSGDSVQPVVQLVDALLADAVRRGASDIHFEPEQGFLRIRCRIDGVLRQLRSLHKSHWAAMAVRLKVLSGMNIAETRSPQDGRVSLRLAGRAIDLRASTQPTTHGENIVLRILDRERGILPLAGLGLRPDDLQTLERMLARPEGIILVTGPTGSGKTTTLYSLLSHLNAEGVNIMTLEDPVEYPMAMLRQASVNEGAKLDFASGIRSMMRQDPDIILVGEIRDRETAEMAFRAAMTGHQVHSTLHTSSAVGAIPRLLDLGILPDILSGNIIGIIAQRLVRRLCIHCRAPFEPDAATRRLLAMADSDRGPVFRPAGCAKCDHQGYRGRLAVLEILKPDDEIDEMIAQRATAREIRSAADARGFRTLAEDALSRVREGETSLAEVARVVDLTDRAARAKR